MTGKYAADTRVSVDRSREEVYRILTRYGADQRMVGDDPTRVIVGFKLKGFPVQVTMPLPERRIFSSQASYDREIRRLWRVVVLLLKGRLELIADGAETVEQAFMPYLMLPDGSTVGDQAIPAIKQAQETGRMPDSILPGIAPAPKIIALGDGTKG